MRFVKERTKRCTTTVFKKLLDIGDFIGVEGELFTTQVGEKSIRGQKVCFTIEIVKATCLFQKRTMKGRFMMLLRIRKCDTVSAMLIWLLIHKSKETFITRTKVMNEMRSFFNDKGYIEVETPILQPIPGGAAARPFMTHHNALDMPLYLRIANELISQRG